MAARPEQPLNIGRVALVTRCLRVGSVRGRMEAAKQQGRTAMGMGHSHNAVERWLSERAGAGLLILRLVNGGHLIYMTQDNVFSWARMLEFRDFLAQSGFAYPLFCAVLSVIGQCGGGVLLVLGLFTRFGGLVVALNFIVAIWMVDSKQPYPGAYAALSLLAGGLCLMFSGARSISLDHVWRRRA